jgi:CBS domain-containing protein
MKQWTVQDVMITDVVTVLTDTPYSEIVSTLARYKISAVPVLDGFGHVVGVVSEADLLLKMEFAGDDAEPRFFEWGTRKTKRTKARGATAAELMTSPAITVQPGVPLAQAAKHLDSEGIKRLPVTDEHGRLVGIVSRRDLLRMYLRPDYQLRQEVVEDVLRRLLWIDPLTVEVDVTDGVVTLNGLVDRKSTAEIAVHVTNSVPGVINVVNQLAWNYDDTAVSASTGL